MALPATDSFAGVDGTTLVSYSANWTANSSTFAIAALGTVRSSGNSAECIAGWNADTFNDAQYSKVTLFAVASSATDIGASVRCSTTPGVETGYEWYTDTGGSFVAKLIAGTWTQIGSNGTAATTGQVMQIDASGTTLTPRINGSVASMGPQTDSALSSGRAGLAGYGDGTTNLVSDWEGGNLGGGGGDSPAAGFRSLLGVGK